MQYRVPHLRATLGGAICCFAVFCCERVVIAGMPSPLPSDVRTTLRLSDHAAERFEAISFFVAIVLASAFAVKLVWNYVRRDFSSLPRLTYLRALGAVLLWGLTFVVVLTMISGARELMTPGAWEKRGFTYQLVGDRQAPKPTENRRQKLEALRTELWKFAATHNGRFPSQAEADRFPADLWATGKGADLRYLYFPGHKAGQVPAVLAIEPELRAGEQLVLMSDGVIVRMTPDEVATLIAGKTP